MRIAICGTDDKAFKIKSILDRLAYHNIVVGMFIGPDAIGLCHDNIPIIPENECTFRLNGAPVSHLRREAHASPA